MQTAALSLAPTLLRIVAEREPALRIDMAQVPPEEGLFELEARGFDLVVAEQYPGHTREHRSGLERDVLGIDPVRIALPPDDPATSLADLRDRVWVMEPTGTAARQWAVQQCRAMGFEPEVRFELPDLVSHVRLITAGYAVGVLPDLLWAEPASPVKLVDLPGAPTREVFTSLRSSSTAHPHIRAVRRALRDAYIETAARTADQPFTPTQPGDA